MRTTIINSLQAQLPAYFLSGCMLAQTLLPGMVLAGMAKDHSFRTADGSSKKNIVGGQGVVPAALVVENSETVLQLPGGPDQPEVQGFTPVGADNLVDPFTGDFSYNIPLMDVDGYPINIAYSAGVTMDQEASWVGLGWNLNPGVINRHLRGLPDDFAGDKVTKEFNMKRNWTAGVNVGASLEAFSFEGFALSASLGVNYNNYNGFGAEFSLTPSFSISGKNGNFGASLGISGNSQSGASVSPNLSVSRRTAVKDGKAYSKGINIGTSLNSRGGISNFSVGYSNSVSQSRITSKDDKGNVTVDQYAANSSVGPRSSFNIGMSTYTPQITMPLSSYAFSGRFKLGPDAIGIDGTVDLAGYYSAQWLKSNVKIEQSYGYMYLQHGQNNVLAMLDFNRENDGSFTKNTPALPVPALTYDIYSVSGHGVSGSYRAYRADIGHVFDPYMANNSVNTSVGAEIGLGATFKAGVDVSGTTTSSKSDPWNDHTNAAAANMRYASTDFHFREANELSVESDPSHFSRIGGSEAARLRSVGTRGLQNILENASGSPLSASADYNRSGQDKRNQVLYALSNAELQQGMGVDPIHAQAYSNTHPDVGHHIGQFTTLTTEGTRYIYGIAAYSHTQKNVSFAVGASASGPGLLPDCTTGRVAYTAADASLSNSKGTDHHYNAETLPPFAHSYLLTSVLNADYVDADHIKGPSKGDLGGYLHFEYKKIDNYQWRNPVNEYEAFYDEGLNADKGDDKGHYIYGEKELWYVDKICSKNQVAVFYTSNRSDGRGVNAEQGGVSSGNPSMQKLDSIKLYSLADYEANPATAVPIKAVHFEYDYSLCRGYDQNNDSSTEGGKLTLKKVSFTYEHSHKGRHTPYTFEYGFNPDYDLKSVDRWGTYKQKPVSCSNDVEDTGLRPSDFPYTGHDKAQADVWAGAWAISRIYLPSGGKIEIDYEADDYAYVQHKRAHQMFKIIGVEGQSPSNDVQNISSESFKNKPVYFEMIPGTNIGDYGKYGDMVYFRALMKFDDNRYDFVPGWAKISEITTGTYNGVACGKLILQAARLNDNGSSEYNPISVAAIQFGRLHLSRMLPPSNQNSIDGEGSTFLDVANALAGAFTSFGELFTGPNIPLWKADVGTHLVRNKSWVRLQNPDRKKLGGGHRVKEVRMYDAWDALSGSGQEMHYGQQYSYTLEDGSSSGVAAYEPQLGGDENVWRTPIANNIEYTLAPDIRNYQETPFGEQFFPSPTVGYSRVTVKNLPREGVTRTATGKVVHEFYTAKDYPTIAKRTGISTKAFKLPLYAIFFNMNIDELSASQGFVVENNDMHGKPKSQMVYAEGQSQPISKVEYFYRDEPIVVEGIAARHLVNEVRSIRKNGTVTTSVVGRTYEAVADFRSSSSSMYSGSVDINLNYTLPFILVPMVLGSGSMEKTEFRSAAFVKTIERKGILSRTVATDLGSEVATNNLAFDAETGEVLLTQTTTDFNDNVYNFTYPAHWYYDGMGQAYKNVGLERTGNIAFTANGVTASLNAGICSVGDEIGIVQGGTIHHGWVREVSNSSAKVILKDGSPVQGSASKIKILRSGRKNLQNTPIGTIVMRENPLGGISSNIFEKILQAGSVEYVDEWGTFCECFVEREGGTTNPYVLGLKGSWRPKASYVHLSGRTQTFENTNSNIREDGVFTSFTPFYKLNGGTWNIDRQDWTYTSRVTEFSPYGQPLETVDALNRHSASQYGYNQALQIAASANTRYRQLGFDSFEDYDFDNCSDDHFKVGAGAVITAAESHSGRRSLEVTAGSPVVYSTAIVEDCRQAADCELDVATLQDGELKTYEIHSGTAPYQYTIQLISGDITDWISGNLVSISLYELPIEYIITITDADGCIYTDHGVITSY